MNALIALALAAAQQTALPNSVSVSRTGEDWSSVTITLGFDAEAGDSARFTSGGLRAHLPHRLVRSPPNMKHQHNLPRPTDNRQ